MKKFLFSLLIIISAGVAAMAAPKEAVKILNDENAQTARVTRASAGD